MFQGTIRAIFFYMLFNNWLLYWIYENVWISSTHKFVVWRCISSKYRMSDCKTLSNHSISYLLEKAPSWIFLFAWTQTYQQEQCETWVLWGGPTSHKKVTCWCLLRGSSHTLHWQNDGSSPWFCQIFSCRAVGHNTLPADWGVEHIKVYC